ncbi:MAG: hypothetical protein ACHQK8_02320 [Bacteroidia bacterium]
MLANVKYKIDNYLFPSKYNFAISFLASFCLLLSFCKPKEKQNSTKDFTGYYELINKYLICNADSDSVGAYQNLKRALDNYNGFSGDYDELIEMELKKGNREAALKCAQKMVSIGYQFFNESIENYGKIKLEYEDSVFIKVIIVEYPKWRKEYLANRSEYYNLLNLELNRMAGRAQYVRGRIDTKGLTTWKYSYEVDSINYVELKEIILKNGFPDRIQLDLRTAQGFNQILLYSRFLDLTTKTDEKEMQWYDSTLRTAVFNGNISPQNYAGITDYYYCLKAHFAKKEESQMYGEYNWLDKFNPIMDIKNVDKRRKELFLIPLSYKAKLDHLKLPAGYK